MAKGLRERVGKQYTGTQRTRNAVHGECTVELAKWTFLIISRSREPYEAKVSRTGLTGGMGRRTVRQRALCLPTKEERTVPGRGEPEHQAGLHDTCLILKSVRVGVVLRRSMGGLRTKRAQFQIRAVRY